MTKTPRARGSKTGRPVMVLLDLVGRRWALRVIWELRGAPLTSRALRAACGDISPSVLQARLDELRDASLVTTDDAGYTLTPLGHELVERFLPLVAWSERWASR